MIIKDIPGRNARNYPNKTALVFKENRYTFRELNNRINSLAHALTEMRLTKGDRIAVIADNCHQHVEMVWTAVKMGIAIIPLNPNLPQGELSYIINNAGARAVVFGENYRPVVESLRPQLEGVDQYIVIGASTGEARSYEELISSYSPLEPEVKIGDDDLIFLACTSGTTGPPKLVMHTPRSLLAGSLEFVHAFNSTEEDVLLYAGPPFWAHDLPLMTITSFYVGSTIVIASELSPLSILETVEKDGVTGVVVISALIPGLVNYPALSKYNHDSLRWMGVGGAPLPPEVWRQAINSFGNIFIQVYGLSEMLPITLLCSSDFILEGPPEKVERLRSCGKETINTEVKVVDEQGNEVPPGQLGEVIAKGGSMMEGYWNAPRATEETIKGGYLYTGDLATVDDEGYIYLAGRKKDAITTQERVIIPTEIEDIIYRHPQVAEAVVIGLPHEVQGEIIKAVVVLKPGGKASQEEIIELCRQHLRDYAVPWSVDFVDSLPRNPSGKVLRRELRARYLEA